ncbi:siderophore-iron reductase FhuF [Acetobacteraceae bacterium H6797]|nr:siderophore-iron reductase FhuF [Acetobacteraceae bacterium H6797]
MIEALAPVFAGPLDFARHWLELAEAPEPLPRRPIALSTLLEEEVQRPLMARHEARYPGGDRRAALSMWTQYYCAQYLLSHLGAWLLLGRMLPFRPDDIAVLVLEDGTPDGFRLPHLGAVAEGPVDLEPLIREHLAPLFQSLQRHHRIAPRVLWTNAAVRVSAALNLARQQPDVPPLRLLEAEALLAKPCWRDGSPNPLHGTQSRVEVEGEMVLRRRVCCLRYMLPGIAGCGATCPIKEGQSAKPLPLLKSA